MYLQAYCNQGQEDETIDVAEAWAFATAALYWWQRPFRRWLFAAPKGIEIKVAILDGEDNLQVKIR